MGPIETEEVNLFFDFNLLILIFFLILVILVIFLIWRKRKNQSEKSFKKGQETIDELKKEYGIDESSEED